MGYYTNYALQAYPYDMLRRKPKDIELPDSVCKAIEAEIEKMDLCGDGNIVGGYYCEAKWYDYERDMCLLSRKFPDVLFVLHGEGADSDDLWDAYFQDGKVQRCPARIIYDEFSSDRLQPLDSPLRPNEKYSYQVEDDDDE